MSIFKKTVKDELTYQDMSIKELVAKTGIPRPTIDHYLGSRESMPPADAAVKIARALHTTVEYLVTGKKLNEETQLIEKKDAVSLQKDFENIPQELQEALCLIVHSLAKAQNSKKQHKDFSARDVL